MSERGGQEQPGEGHGNASDNAETETFVAAARTHFARAFPNPRRAGCPPRAALERAQQASFLPDRALQEHLCACSDCFSAYREMLARRRGPPDDAPPKWSWRAVRAWFKRPSLLLLAHTPRPFRVLAGVLALAGLLFVMYYRRHPPPVATPVTDLVAAAEPPPFMAPVVSPRAPAAGTLTAAGTVQPRLSRPAPPGNTAPPRPAPGMRVPPPGRTGAVPATADLDLRERALMRGAETSAPDDQSAWRVPPQRIRLRLRLPPENPGGYYQVLLTDAFGQSLLTRRALHRPSRRLSVSVNLRKYAGRKTHLCLARQGEIPDCYPLTVTTHAE